MPYSKNKALFSRQSVQLIIIELPAAGE